MKPAIAFAVVRPTHWGDWEVMEVTSRPPSPHLRGKWYGRVAGGATSKAACDVIASFPTREAADAAMTEARAITARHEPLIKDARKALANAESAYKDERREAMAQAAALAAKAASGQACDKPS